jgi:hypothetical protein
MKTELPETAEQIATLRRQWEMVRKSLPEDEKALENILNAQPEETREGLRKQFREMVATRDQIERRLKALESVETPVEDDVSLERWQHLLMKVMLFGWPTFTDFVRLEGRMPENWPATRPHSSVEEWVPFTNWCARHWARDGRVRSILGLDVRPEIATTISPPLRMALISSSRHDLNLTGFLDYRHHETGASGQRSALAASLGDTGHHVALELTQGSVQGVLIGRSAWKKWHSMDPVMMEWMFSELASKSLYLAIECGENDQIPVSHSGWIAEPNGPEKGLWKVWKSCKPLPGTHGGTFIDLRTHGLRVNGLDSDRKAVLSGDLLSIFHADANTLLREREAWKSLAGSHPMIPCVAEGGGDLFFQLHLPGDSARWMPIGRGEKRTGACDLAALFALLQDRELLPPGLGVGDFIATGSGTFLSRIGFEGHRTVMDPLGLFLATLASWNLMESPPVRTRDEVESLSEDCFPLPFRELARQALSSMSFRDLMNGINAGERCS